jgi:hypothetical protein
VTSPSMTMRWNATAAPGLALWRMCRTYHARNSSSSARVGVYSRSWRAKNSGVPQLSPTSRSQSRHSSSLRAHG